MLRDDDKKWWLISDEDVQTIKNGLIDLDDPMVWDALHALESGIHKTNSVPEDWKQYFKEKRPVISKQRGLEMNGTPPCLTCTHLDSYPEYCKDCSEIHTDKTVSQYQSMIKQTKRKQRMNDYSSVTKEGVTPVIKIAHQRIGGIHMKFYTKDGYEKAKVLWDGDTLWIEEGSISIHVANIPKVEFDEYS